MMPIRSATSTAWSRTSTPLPPGAGPGRARPPSGAKPYRAQPVRHGQPGDAGTGDQDALVHGGCSSHASITGTCVPDELCGRGIPVVNARLAAVAGPTRVRNRQLALDAAIALLSEPGAVLTVEAIAEEGRPGGGYRRARLRRQGRAAGRRGLRPARTRGRPRPQAPRPDHAPNRPCASFCAELIAFQSVHHAISDQLGGPRPARHHRAAGRPGPRRRGHDRRGAPRRHGPRRPRPDVIAV